jgi:hypothetical protein
VSQQVRYRHHKWVWEQYRKNSMVQNVRLRLYEWYMTVCRNVVYIFSCWHFPRTFYVPIGVANTESSMTICRAWFRRKSKPTSMHLLMKCLFSKALSKYSYPVIRLASNFLYIYQWVSFRYWLNTLVDKVLLLRDLNWSGCLHAMNCHVDLAIQWLADDD